MNRLHGGPTLGKQEIFLKVTFTDNSATANLIKTKLSLSVKR
jgi:hypothetical protein